MEDRAAAQGRNERWQQWVREATLKGGGPAHRYSRHAPQPQLDAMENGVAVVVHNAVMLSAAPWMELWGAIAQPQPEQTQLWAHTLQLARKEPLPRLTDERLLEVIRAYPKGKALGFDVWSMRTWSLLDASFIPRLRQILEWLEHGSDLPKAWEIKTVLLAKPTGGTRPIQLLSAAMRLWAKLRLPCLADWKATH
eukprot:797045-Amphidinium_carterae.1